MFVISQLWAAVLLPVVAGAQVAPVDVYESTDFGFALELPEGWVRSEETVGADTLEVAFAPLSAGDRVQLKVRVNPSGLGRDPQQAVAALLEHVAGDESYSDAERRERRVGERDAPGVVIDSEGADQTWRVRQAFLAGNGLLYQLQDVTIPDEFDARVEGFDAIWDTFALHEPSAERQAQLRLAGLTARCGSEVEWAADWDTAVRRARERGVPILATLRRYPGFDISDERMSGFFMQRDVIDLIAERFVALDVVPGMQVPFADQDVYGMSRYTFGTAMLVVSTEGEVLYDSFAHADPLLVEVLAEDPRLAGPRAARLDDPLDQARLHYRRGELERVDALLSELLADDDSPRALAAWRLRAELAARRSDAEGALAALEHARSLAARRAPEGPARDDLLFDLLVDELPALVGAGRGEQALARLDAALDGAQGHPREAEALYLRGELARHFEDRDSARAWFERLVLDERRADERWTWLAAARLTSTTWAVGETGNPTWPDASSVSRFRPPRYDELPVRQAARAADDAVAWLLAKQKDDGCWPLSSDIGKRLDDPADDFQLAITAICIQGLLPRRDDPAVAQAVERAVAWLLPAYEHTAAAAEPVYFMDYAVWSRPYVLWALADLLDRELVDRAHAQRVAALVYGELAELQKPGGGWSYYVTGDVESAAPAVLVSMSFTTAVNVMALLRARESGLAPPDELIERGLDSLERARTTEGLFVYMVGAEASRPTGPSGAAGRGPLCTWVLQRAGRADAGDIGDALEAFMAHREAYARETGKALMHTGPQAEGSHWLLFDYANAAAAAASLPRRVARRFERPLLELLLGARTDEGAFVDNPLLGPAFGAGMALVGLEHLLPDP